MVDIMISERILKSHWLHLCIALYVVLVSSTWPLRRIVDTSFGINTLVIIVWIQERLVHLIDNLLVPIDRIRWRVVFSSFAEIWRFLRTLLNVAFVVPIITEDFGFAPYHKVGLLLGFTIVIIRIDRVLWILTWVISPLFAVTFLVIAEYVSFIVLLFSVISIQVVINARVLIDIRVVLLLYGLL